jgi:hypothetical protein
VNSVKFEISNVILPFSISRKVPENWQEVTEKTYIRISEALLLGKVTYQFCILARLQPYIFKLVDPLVRLSLIEMIGFTKSLPNHFFTKKIGKRYAPCKDLENLTIGQFATADFYFLKFIKTNDTVFLNKFIASLYLQKGITYTSKTSDDVAFLKRVSIRLKWSVFLSYKGCRDVLITRYSAVFGSIDPDPELPDIGSGEPNPLHIFPLINELSKTTQYGVYAQVFDTDMHTIFFNRQIELQK